jgi:hypothetical protein
MAQMHVGYTTVRSTRGTSLEGKKDCADWGKPGVGKSHRSVAGLARDVAGHTIQIVQ